MFKELSKQEKAILQKFREALYLAQDRHTVKMLIYIYDKGKIVDVELMGRERLGVLEY